ncbi:helicase-exonuclease AddAB subunit AddB [Aciduricibacillus chroicocephali]|uniref:ATP-dependent helicase/deoxyribonuclease subunit B n=1 Tax=Aciduricibacillus chroicocephali TaxID=3054939 RepID=A0ABY9KXE1_9BACI|nr:helicase-exonuclease AddAB subunit AddB [Bacillaceae bacterium 44XB]
MGIRFVLGRSGAGQSEHIIEEIKQKLIENPQGPPIFYVVPEQMTFQQEQELFGDPELGGSIRAQVVSFSRLAWRVLQETGGGTRQFISPVGIRMMLRKIIDEKDDGWNVFQKAIEKQGFLEQLEGMITEFKRYDITPGMLEEQITDIDQFTHKTPREISLQKKLGDLTYIYEHLAKALAGKYMDGEDQLDMLRDRIGTTSFFRDAEIYLDGFYQFAPKEMAVVEALMNKCECVTIALTADPEHLYEENEMSELDLFFKTKETYWQFKQLAGVNGIGEETSVILDGKDMKFANSSAFLHLERNFDSRPFPEYRGEAPIRIAEAVHPRAEVEGMAQEILNLVRDKHCRFKDIVIYMREPDTYHDLIHTIFDDYGIPVFIDEKKPMLHHVLIELIRSALEMVENNWRHDAVFRVLKTGFIPEGDGEFPLNEDAIDELENYVLEYGIRSRDQWSAKRDWKFQRFRGFDEAAQTDEELQMQKRINMLRRQVTAALGNFDEEIRKAETIREKSEAVYFLLERLKVPEQLEKWRTYYDDHGEIERAREQDQVWDAMVQLFDEMDELGAKETISLKAFRETLDAGLESLKFAHVPPSLDQVIVGTIDRSRINGKSHAFLLGVNEGAWPMKPPSDGMISEDERELLLKRGVRLAETSRRKLLDDWFYIYLAFTSAHEGLWVSYPLSDEEGKAKMPSQLIRRLEGLFPSCSERILLQDPDELYDAERFITTPVKTRAALTAQLARKQRNYPVKNIWLDVLNWYIENTPKYSTTYAILQSLHYDNLPTDLAEETVQQLYPKRLKASVSRLEMYHRCSYQHFAQYGLGLQERRTYKLDAPDIGQLFHEALKKIAEWVQGEGKDFSQLTKTDAGNYANKAVKSLAPILQHQILHSSKRYEYIQHKLKEVIARAAYVLSEQARMSGFSPVGLEVGFGEKEELPPLTMQLPNGYELILRGRIDRVDKSISGNDLYLRIIDYKSSSKKLNLTEVYYGLALQMLAYLDVVLQSSEAWLGLKASPAGVLYFHVHNPFISGEKALSEDKLEEELFKKYKMNGLLLADQEVFRLMDKSTESGTSPIVPAGLTKSGSFTKASSIAGKETFNQLEGHIHQLMSQAGLDITSGGIHLNPYELKDQVACTFCPFSSVCQFDPQIGTNEFRKLQQMNEKQVLQKLTGEE